MQDTPDLVKPKNDPASTKTVLIVEDDPDIADALSDLLHDLTPYHVIHALNGETALEIVRTLLPQLVLLDYRLPDIDGLACLNKLRANAGMEQTPVILMSAAFPPHIPFHPHLTFLDKPFEVDTLLEQMRHLLKVQRDVEPELL